jgi:2-hydroxy-6-oxonona-2,4-dienedioate hydrolase
MEHKLKVDGEFSYIEEGDGPTIIVLHGLFGALSNFQEVISKFSKNYRVVIPMLPIYDLPLLNTNVRHLAKFVDRFVIHKGYDKVNLLGNSLGGHVALVYAAKHPSKVNSMILTGSSGLYENAFGGSFPRREDKSFLRDRIAVTFYNPKMVTDELVDECHEAVNSRNKVIKIIAIAKSAIRHNMRNELPKFKMPVCLIWGKNDHITPPHVADEFHSTIPDSDLFWIDKCGHAAMMEHPQEFNNLLEGWLTKRGI